MQKERRKVTMQLPVNERIVQITDLDCPRSMREGAELNDGQNMYKKSVPMNA